MVIVVAEIIVDPSKIPRFLVAEAGSNNPIMPPKSLFTDIDVTNSLLAGIT